MARGVFLSPRRRIPATATTQSTRMRDGYSSVVFKQIPGNALYPFLYPGLPFGHNHKQKIIEYFPTTLSKSSEYRGGKERGRIVFLKSVDNFVLT